MEELDITVASFDEADEILDSGACDDFSCLISIGDPDSRPPAGHHRIRDSLRLAFYDTQDEIGPTDEHVQRIIDLGRRLQGKGRILIHCHAGISRSSAAAYIIYCVAFGPGREAEALERVYAQRPIARPNGLMVAIADRLLGRNGAMSRAIESRMQSVNL